MQGFIEDRHRRRLIVGAALVTLIALLCIRFFVLPILEHAQVMSPLDIVGQVTDNIIVAVIASITIAGLTLWLRPPSATRAVVNIAEPYNIGNTLKFAMTDTSEWWCKVRSGRYFRSEILPAIARDTRRDNAERTVHLLILDPTCGDSCEFYAKYRQGLRSANRDGPWTAQKVREELYATILAAYIWKAEAPLLNISVALFEHVSLFRVDLSRKLVLVTMEDHTEPALRYDAGTVFYKAHLEDLRLELRQAKILPTDVPTLKWKDLNPSNVRTLLNALGIASEDLTPAMIESVVVLARKAENPYA